MMSTSTTRRSAARAATMPRRDTNRRPGPRLPDPDFGPTDRRAGWIVTGVVALFALATRMIGIASVSDKGTPVFDEKHYAPQSFNVSQLGIEENPAYGLVVHPPVAKQIQAIGGWLFGYTPLGWRLMAGLFGVAVIVLVVRMTRRLTRSTWLGGLAGILLISDGVLMVTSRVGMLDIYQVFFVTAAAACLLVDRDRMRERMHLAALAGRIDASPFGPRLGFRWWRFSAGLMLGLACGVKWSGLYYVAFFGVLAVCMDIALRKRYGVQRPVVGVLVRDAFPAFASLVLWAVVVYGLTWLPWFADENSVYRHAASSQPAEKLAPTFLPDAVRSWLYYQSSVMDFHSSLTTSAGNMHPWESKPFAWPMSLRPMLYYLEQGHDVTGCGQDECVRAILLNGTPTMWWLAIPVLAFALWRAVLSRDGRYAFALVGYAAGIVPWFFLFDRQMYFFYGALLIPFYVVILALILGEIAGVLRARRSDPRKDPAIDASDDRATGDGTPGADDADPDHSMRGTRAAALFAGIPQRRLVGIAVVSVYVALVVGNYAYMYPVLTGLPITTQEWQEQLWLPSWR